MSAPATAPAAPPAPQTPTDRMRDIVALCKRRGFVFPASEIYGGINGFWDFGPLGTELKNNVRDLWWRAMVKCPPIGPDGQPVTILGLDSSIIQNPKVWEASGHVGGFSDPMSDCRESKKRYRVDHVVVYTSTRSEAPWIAVPAGDGEQDVFERRLKKFGGKLSAAEYTATTLDKIALADFARIVGPDATKPGTLTEPKAFNLLMETSLGAVAAEDAKAYLRGETAQGIFINFHNVVNSSRTRPPFGIAQIGKAFRNEVNPRNFIFRVREFEQMEMEFFCHPDEARMWFDFWVEQRKIWWQSIGISDANRYLHEYNPDELIFYSKRLVDVEYKFPFTDPNFGELESIAYRTDYDLTQHQKFSGQKLEYFDQENNTRYIPHVIEPAAGLTRGVLALICEAYTVDPNRPSGVYLNFHPAVAPIKAAILPLTAKGEHPKIATDLYLKLRNDYMVDLDIKQNIGKRYARQDEIGTPFCFTIDDQTVTDGTVTVRHRNTMQQTRVHLDQVAAYLDEHLKAF